MDTKNKLGKRIIRALITEEKQKQLIVRLKDRSRTRLIKEYCNKEEASLKALFQTCLEHILPITTPPVLISPMPYSGGPLLNRLFDGHPAIYAYPDELLKGVPAQIPWTEIDPKDNSQRWIEILFDNLNTPNIPHRSKPDTKHNGALPFLFLPLLQKQIFIKYLNTIKMIKPRDVFDAYMTSCFGAWLNYQNHSQHKKFLTVLAPGLVTQQENMESYLNIYPDGRFISLVENPHNWCNSALQAEPEKYADVNCSVMRWKESLHSALWAKARFADRTCLIRFEDLVNRPEPVMQHLAKFLGIPYDPILLKQTFNGYPISAHSSFKMEPVEVTKRHSKDYPNLAKDQSKIIAEMTNGDYLTALKEAVSFQ
jgi:hypothetical protein